MGKKLTIEQHIAIAEKLKQAQQIIESVSCMLPTSYPEAGRLETVDSKLLIVRSELEERLWRENPKAAVADIYFGRSFKSKAAKQKAVV